MSINIVQIPCMVIVFFRGANIHHFCDFTYFCVNKMMLVILLVYILPLTGFLLGYFLSAGLAEKTRYIIAIAGAVLFYIPSVFYDRYAKRHETLTYTILQVL